MKTMRSNQTTWRAIVPLIVVVTGSFLNSCSGEKDSGSGQTQDRTVMHIEEPGQPTADISVSRTYNTNGSLVQFDSTHTAYSEGVIVDSAMMDSLVIPFYTLYRDKHASLYKTRFDMALSDDSMLYVDFLQVDFLRRRYALNVGYIDQLLGETDMPKKDDYKNTWLYLEKGNE